jgi:predicted nucleotidyltransferase
MPNQWLQQTAAAMAVSESSLSLGAAAAAELGVRLTPMLWESKASARGGCKVQQLSAGQRELVTSLSQRLGAIRGIQAVVLGGSYARGCARPGSDIDLYLYYAAAAPFSLQALRDLASSINDDPRPAVTDFYGWGPWVNGGAWLTVGGQRVDFIYRSLEDLERVLAEAEAGRYEFYSALPPFGFFGPVYLGEVAVGVPLSDPEGRIGGLKRRVADYPEPLRRAVVQDYLWAAELSLTAFAPKFAGRSGAYGTAACLTRVVHQLLLALFALNRKYLLDDKTALADAAEFERAPREFGSRVQQTLAHLGTSPAELAAAVEGVARLFRETVELTDGLYQPRFTLPT